MPQRWPMSPMNALLLIQLTSTAKSALFGSIEDHNESVALFTTDLDLTVEQIIEYYGAHWKTEAGFKEIKQEIGSSKSQTRNYHAVINHPNFCMMAVTVTWITPITLIKQRSVVTLLTIEVT